MRDIVQVGAGSIPESQGTGKAAGQSQKESQNLTDIQSTENMQAGKEPSGEGLPEGFDTLENAAKIFKDHQRLVSKTQNQNKELEGYIADLEAQAARFGGLEQLFQSAAFLQTDPGFQEYVKKAQNNEAGLPDKAGLDQEQRDAYDFVQKVARGEAQATKAELQQMINQLVEEKINPVVETTNKSVAEKNAALMDDKFPGWRSDADVNDAMEELIRDWPQKKADNPSFKDMKTVYFSALEELGRLDDIGAATHNAKLKKAKSESTDMPPTMQTEGEQPEARNFREALMLAKKKLNWAGPVTFR